MDSTLLTDQGKLFFGKSDYLNSDFRSLPSNLFRPQTGAQLVQLVKCLDVSRPVGPEDEEEENSVVTITKGNRLLRFTFVNVLGTKFEAIELATCSIPKEIAPGTKFSLTGEILNGYIAIESPTQLRLLGGRVGKLAEGWALNKDVKQRRGGGTQNGSAPKFISFFDRKQITQKVIPVAPIDKEVSVARDCGVEISKKSKDLQSAKLEGDTFAMRQPKERKPRVKRVDDYAPPPRGAPQLAAFVKLDSLNSLREAQEISDIATTHAQSKTDGNKTSRVELYSKAFKSEVPARSARSSVEPHEKTFKTNITLKTTRSNDKLHATSQKNDAAPQTTRSNGKLHATALKESTTKIIPQTARAQTAPRNSRSSGQTHAKAFKNEQAPTTGRSSPPTPPQTHAKVSRGEATLGTLETHATVHQTARPAVNGTDTGETRMNFKSNDVSRGSGQPRIKPGQQSYAVTSGHYAASNKAPISSTQRSQNSAKGLLQPGFYASAPAGQAEGIAQTGQPRKASKFGQYNSSALASKKSGPTQQYGLPVEFPGQPGKLVVGSPPRLLQPRSSVRPQVQQYANTFGE